ncbi:hypothetical protein GE061_018130 [Apolygus lucorum]|uniref:Uncharacterized protein n=1 Tax=Apolygus lucorum TaxID=248454 RepID=A0A8S9XEE8_APOLU|nr:hypothetical protein GE061_018130 [Apolygus lucorum]
MVRNKNLNLITHDLTDRNGAGLTCNPIGANSPELIDIAKFGCRPLWASSSNLKAVEACLKVELEALDNWELGWYVNP